MLLKDSFVIHAPLDMVWAALEDIPLLGDCVPGVQGLQQVDANTYNGILVVKVGPIRSAFDGQVTFTERVPEERISARVEGQDKTSATFVTATFSGTLTAGDEGTTLHYEVDLALRGRLAQFGLAVVQATAKLITAEFARCLEARLSNSTSSNR